jgi:hypothetical protein
MPSGTFDQVALADRFGCARLASDRTLVCWGSHFRAKMPGVPNPALDPLSMLGAVDAVAAGANTACVLSSGHAQCFGEPLIAVVPAEIQAASFVALTVGAFDACGLEMDGTVRCWGDASTGGVLPCGGYSNDRTMPPPGPAKSVSMGDFHGCLVESTGQIACWGFEDLGRTCPPPGAGFERVSCGYEHCCALKSDGTVECWGTTSDMQTKFSDVTPPDDRFVDLSSGQAYTCGLRADGTYRCFGDVRQGK